MDVSRFGARLVTQRPPEGPFEIELNLEHDLRLAGEARPLWRKQAEDGTCLLGVELRLKGPGRHLLGPWLQRQMRSERPAGLSGRPWRTGTPWRTHRVPSSSSKAR